ncbi:MAG: hypothetical protein JXA09_15620 [Anaerolineae bacterium]|nr:hypothetical protein [Anaerolineae bacterium]
MTQEGAEVSGAQALALGAIEAGVALVTGYPGSPVTPVVDEIAATTDDRQVQVEWTSNEKVAIEIAYGASLGGARALLCVKSVGMNVALDPLMAFALSGCHAGLVLLVGDDPGGWGSQNEQDSRVLGLGAEMPVLEPCTVAAARAAMREGFALSERLGMPVMVRVTRALVLAQERTSAVGGTGVPELGAGPPSWVREWMRWVVLPTNVVPYHRRQQERLSHVRQGFEVSPLNVERGSGPWGAICAGYAYQKVCDLLGAEPPAELRVLGLGTFHPLPAGRITSYLQRVKAALVVEETAPLLEQAVRAAAQSAGLDLPILGRDTGHVPVAGELFATQIADALNRAWPSLSLQAGGTGSRSMPSQRALCEGCPYVPVFDALLGAIDARGGRDRAIVVGDPGCMVRGQLEPYRLLDVKNSLGSSIGTAAGIALAQQIRGCSEQRRVIALAGDSGFLHTGLNGLMDAARLDLPMLVVILDNGTTALSGGQPHPGTARSARGAPRRAVDLAEVARAVGAERVAVVNLDRGEEAGRALARGLDSVGLTVVVARGRCPQWS